MKGVSKTLNRKIKGPTAVSLFFILPTLTLRSSFRLKKKLCFQFYFYSFQLRSVQFLLSVASSRHHQTAAWRHRWKSTPIARSHVHRDTSCKVRLISSVGHVVNGQTELRMFHVPVSWNFSVYKYASLLYLLSLEFETRNNVDIRVFFCITGCFKDEFRVI